MLHHVLRLARRAVGRHPDYIAVEPDPSVPRHRDARFDRQPAANAWRQNGVAISLVLLLENIFAGHADDAHRLALLFKLRFRLDYQLQLRARAEQNNVRRLARSLGNHVAAATGAGGGRELGAIESRHFLAREREQNRALRMRHRDAPGLDRLVGVAGANHREMGNRAQGSDMLDWLVGRAVFADADRIMRENEHHLQLHQRRQPNRRARVVGEAEKARAVWDEAAVQRDAVEDRAHAVLADSKMRIGPSYWPRSKSPPSLIS